MANCTQEELNLKSALISTGILIPLESSASEMEVTVLCRLTKGQESVWLQAVNELLETAEQAGFKAHICKIFLRRDGKLCSAWNIGIRGSSLEQTAQAVEIVSNVLGQWKPSLIAAEDEPRRPLPDRLPYEQDEEPRTQPVMAPNNRAPRPQQPRPRTDQEAMQQIMEQPRRGTPHTPQGMQPLGVRSDPPQQDFTARHFERQRDDGKIEIVDEIPLPHVGGDYNRPSQPVWSEKHGKYIGGGKGAKGIG